VIDCRGVAIFGTVVVLLTSAGFALTGFESRAASVASVGAVQPQAAYSINYHFYDFFNVPYREYWDLRTAAKYGDLPMNAECFSAEGVAEGTCVPSNPSVPDVASYPYADWYPSTTSISPTSTSTIPFIYAPYRMQAIGTSVPGYTLTDPVYLPIQNPAAAVGTSLGIDWRMDYITKAQGNTLKNVAGCPLNPSFNDGYYVRSELTVTLDLQESRRLFGVVATDAASAQNWWSANTNPACGTSGTEETNWQNAIVALGGSAGTPGKFDIFNGYDYYYSPFYTNMTASVALDGTTTVKIDHLAFGTEVLLARMFYWGNAGYLGNTLNSSKRTGWWGMEAPWFESFHFTTTIGASTHDFSLTTALFYHLQANADAGPNGLYDKTDDIPFWDWGPSLADYGFFSPVKHPENELSRYPDPPYAYPHATTGSFDYGVSSAYDYVPVTWNLKAGESWSFTLPKGNVNFYDPNHTPAGADPTKGQFVTIQKPLYLMRTLPSSYGTWDEPTNTWTLTGPATTGGPPGNPGPDGMPGTSDDQYPTYSYPSIDFQPGPALLRVTTNPALPGKIIVDGVPRDEWGLAWMKIAPGRHLVSFGGLNGLATPAAQTVTVTSGATATVQGNYGVNGYLRVITNPALASTISVNGVPRNDWGMWTALPPGTYTVHFGLVAGYNPPADQTAIVSAGSTMTITGTFTSNPTAPGPDPTTFGYLRVTTNPARAAQILVNGVPRDDWGLTWVKLAPGTYTVSFGEGYGYTPPAPKTVNVAAGATTTWDAPFVVHGSLRVTTDAPSAATVFVNGLPRDDWGMWQSIAPGTYTVSFGDVSGYVTPASQTAVVTANALTSIAGHYVAAALAQAATIPSGAVVWILLIAAGIASVASWTSGTTSAAALVSTSPSKVED